MISTYIRKVCLRIRMCSSSLISGIFPFPCSADWIGLLLSSIQYAQSNNFRLALFGSSVVRHIHSITAVTLLISIKVLGCIEHQREIINAVSKVFFHNGYIGKILKYIKWLFLAFSPNRIDGIYCPSRFGVASKRKRRLSHSIHRIPIIHYELFQLFILIHSLLCRTTIAHGE